MKILYGVQGTGNGHITRARTMARALKNVGAEVDWVFSGRDRKDLFDMEVFGDFQVFRGLTFVIRHGRVLYPQTVMQNNVLQLFRDAEKLNVDGYDLILNDFEPVSAWAAKRKGKHVIGISHQMAFHHNIPKRGNNPFVAWFMRNFAPVSQPIGVHWHHFDQPILPPLVEPSNYRNEIRPGHCLVYLPFMSVDEMVPHLRAFPDHHFYTYQPVREPRDDGNIHVRPFSREGFQRDLHMCEGVICNAGFELASESIQLGKKLLVQPVKGQMEQLSNALALEQLSYGSVAKKIDAKAIGRWLKQPQPQPVPYPNVADALARWLVNGGGNFEALRDELWRHVPEPAGQLATSVG